MPWTYRYFGTAKNAYLPDKKAQYIWICQFKDLLLSERPLVRIPSGTPETPGNAGFFQVSSALFFCTLAKIDYSSLERWIIMRDIDFSIFYLYMAYQRHLSCSAC